MPSLGNDLATIRKGRGLSLDEIHQSTKIPISVLISIENDSIFQDMAGNATYVRSYVRSYAKELAIEEREIVFALNKVEKGQYKGSLIDEDQHAGPGESGSEEEQPESDKDFWSELSDEELRQKTSPDNPISKSQEVESIDWVDMGYQFQPAKRLRSNRPIIGLFIFLLIAVIGFAVYWFYFRADEPSTQELSGTTVPTETSSPPDSLDLSADLLTTSDSAALTPPDAQRTTLPDTLSIVLYAAYGKLQPVRVYTDIAGQLNPYWIEQGEANEFHFVNEFHFRNGLDNIVLLMNGHVIRNFREQFFNPKTGRVEINRSFFAQDDKWLQPASDTLSIKAPPPSVIHEIES